MALSRDKAIVIGVVLLGGLSFLVYKQAKHDEAIGSAAKVDLPDVKGTDDLDKFEITAAGKPTLTFVKDGDAWTIQDPHVPANVTNVKLMFDNLKELKAKEVIATSPDDSVKTSYELDPAHAVHFVGYKGADKKVDDLFGKSGGRGQMMLTSATPPQIVAVTGYSQYLYSREVKDWRVKEMFKFDDTNVASLAIDDKAGKFSCTKGDHWACTFNGQPIPNFDENKPADAVRLLKSLNADDFAAYGKTATDVGLDNPDGTITVTLKDGAGTYVLKVGQIATYGTNRFAVKDADPVVYIVNAQVSAWGTATIGSFQKSADAGAPAPMAAKSSSPHPAIKPH